MGYFNLGKRGPESYLDMARGGFCIGAVVPHTPSMCVGVRAQCPPRIMGARRLRYKTPLSSRYGIRPRSERARAIRARTPYRFPSQMAQRGFALPGEYFGAIVRACPFFEIVILDQIAICRL